MKTTEKQKNEHQRLVIIILLFNTFNIFLVGHKVKVLPTRKRARRKKFFSDKYLINKMTC